MNLPSRFIEIMKEMLKDEFDEFYQSYQTDTYTGIRINPKKENTNLFFNEYINPDDKIPWCPDGYYTNKQLINGNHPYHLSGMCYFQEPSAMSVVEALPINPDDFVLDLCAAPGGKATQVGTKLGDCGLLVANEIIKKRALVLAQTIERFGFKNAIVTNEAPDKLSDKFSDFFDKIIVDAPCSGEGMFKKEPQAVEEWSENHTKTCATRQKHILDCAYKMLRCDGYIVYSTCTFSIHENEGVIDYFLSKYPDMELSQIELANLQNGFLDIINSDFDLSKTKRLFPHKVKGEGHFLALLHKKGERRERYYKQKKTDNSIKSCVSLYRDFEKKALNVTLDGCFQLNGDNLYLIPHGVDTDKLKLVRAGLYLGVIQKNRFEPSHALCMSLKFSDFKSKISFSADDKQLLKYLHGETINSDLVGYTAIAVDENPIGWAKGSCGILKNHFPKHLRLN